MFVKGDRIVPMEDDDNLCGGVVMEDVVEDFTSRPRAVYVKLDDSTYPEYYDAMQFRKESK
jgi:hypothetical protein